jgi:Protein of unknown function (DUF4242)
MTIGPTFLLEAYVPRTAAGAPAAAAARARAAAAAMRREGRPIRVVRSFFMPDDELWFCLYEAPSLDDVSEASRRAGLMPGRIQRADDDEGGPSAGRAERSEK